MLGKQTGPGYPPKWIKTRLEQIGMTLKNPPRVTTTEASAPEPVLTRGKRGDNVDETLTTICANEVECQGQNEQKLTKAKETTMSDQPFKGRYNLRSRTQNQPLESSLTDRGDDVIMRAVT